MNGQWKCIATYAIVLFITLLAWVMGLTHTQIIQEYNTTVEFRYTEQKLNLKKVEEIFKREKESEKKKIESMIAWRQEKSTNVQNTSLGNTADTEVLSVYGDLSILITRDKLTGEWMYPEDEEGVIISKGLADKLWGNLDIIGKPVVYENKEYIVRGVLDEERALLVTMEDSSKQEETNFDGLRIKFLEHENIQEQAKEFENRYGLSKSILIDRSLMSNLIGQLMLLPAWGIGLLILIRMYRLIYETYRYWIACIGLCIIGVGITWIVMKTIQFPIEIPSAWIPNKWSDFDFWGKLIEELKQNAEAIKEMQVLLPDLWIREIARQIFINFGIVLIGFSILIRKVKVLDLKSLFWTVLIAIGVSFLAIVTNYLIGYNIILIRAIWLIWPINITMKYFTKQVKSYLQIEG